MNARGWLAGAILAVNLATNLMWFPLSRLLGVESESVDSLMNAIQGSMAGVSLSIVGALIAVRQPGNANGWLFLAVGFSQGLANVGHPYATYGLLTQPGSLPFAAEMVVPALIGWAPGLSLLLTYCLLLFPTGRLPSRGWRPVAWLSAVPLAMMLVLMISVWPHRSAGLLENPDRFLTPGVTLASQLMFPLMLICGLLSVASLAFRFYRSRGVERQQLKWFAFAAALTFTYVVARELAPATPFLPIAPAIPIAAGIAILRYRLYDIDVLINRAIVYALLSAALAGIYLTSVVLLQAPVRTLSGGDSQLAVVASTLLMASAFAPLRRRLQAWIDRVFYRQRYDTRAALASFDRTARTEVALEPLVGDLLGTIGRTVQPTHVSLWLRGEDEP